MKKAFSMIELIFVIVIIGVLSAIAIPKFAATRDDAVITKARATVGAIRSAVATERQKRVLKGDFTDLTGSDVSGLLDTPIDSSWSISGDTFTFTGPSGNTCVFKLDQNKFVSQSCSVTGMTDL